MNMQPIQYPILRAAKPVVRVNATIPGWIMVGTAARQRSLYLPEVYGPVIAPRGPLQGDSLAVGLDLYDDAEENKRWKQRPEWDAEVQLQPWPLLGKANPRGFQCRS